MYACLVLPFPPTANNLFAGKARRFPSKAYKDWQDEAARILTMQAPLPRFDGPVSVTMSFGRPDKRKRDLANLEKATTDQLVKAGVLADDSLIERLTMQWSVDVAGALIQIESVAA